MIKVILQTLAKGQDRVQRRNFLKTASKVIGSAALSAPLISGCSQTPINHRPITNRTAKRLYIDGLSFVPSDLADIKASELNGYIADISAIEAITQADGTVNYKRTYQACMNSIKQHVEQLNSAKHLVKIATSGADLQHAIEHKKCAVFLQIQGADCVEGGLHQVDEFHQLGLRVLQLTHHYNNKYAGGALSLDNATLSKDGIALIEKLQSKNMLIDLSHSSVATAEHTLALAQKPVVQSHGAARAIVNNARCSPDHIIKGIADSGGVFGVFMMSWWLTNEPIPRPEHYINHLKHLKNIAGSDVVAIANDYPLRGHEKALAAGNNNQVAIDGYQQWWQQMGKRGVLGFDKDTQHIVIPELNHIKRMRTIEFLLSRAGFTSSEIDKAMGENWQRVLTEVIL